MNLTIEEQLSYYSDLLSKQAMFLSEMRRNGQVQRLQLLWEMLREERSRRQNDLGKLQAQLSSALSSVDQYERLVLKYRERNAPQKAQKNINEDKHPSQQKNIQKAEQQKEQSQSDPIILSNQELLPAQEKEKLNRGLKDGKYADKPVKRQHKEGSSTEPKEEKEDIEYAQSLFSKARQKQDEHKYGVALQLYQQCLLIRERINGKENIETADVLHQIGKVYYCQRDYTKALEYYGSALGIYERVKGKGCFESANTLNNMGLVYDDQRDYAKALECYSFALGIYEKVKGKGCFESADTLSNMGSFYKNQRDYAKALECYSLALGIYEKVKGKGCFESANTLHNMGSFYKKQRDYAKALKYQKEAKSIYEKFNIKDREYGNTLFNMGNTYSKLKDFEAAVEAYGSSLKVYERLNLQDMFERGALKLAKCLKILKRDKELQLITSKYGLENKI